MAGTGETKPALFKITSIRSEGFTCENFNNKFPKKLAIFKVGIKSMQ